MTFVQMQYLLEIARHGSISGAARKLFTTQSNLSTLIKNVEQEIGITVFTRTRDGVIPTPEGQRLLTLITENLRSYNEIMHLGSHKEHQELLVTINNGVTPMNDAFLTLCRRHQDDPSYDFSLFSSSHDCCLQAATSHHNAVSGIMVPRQELFRFLEQLEQLQLVGERLGIVPLHIYFRKEHPILQHWVPGEPFPFLLLDQYPSVDYVGDLVKEYTKLDSYDFLPHDPKCTIHFTNPQMKFQLIRTTDAFSFGISCAKQTLEVNDLLAVPLPGCSMYVYCCYNPSHSDTPLVHEYIDLVRQELELHGILINEEAAPIPEE